MKEYWEKINDKDKDCLQRGMFLIVPIRFVGKFEFEKITFEKGLSCDLIEFSSNDFIELMNNKCSKQGGFVHRYKINVELTPIEMENKTKIIDISNLQLFIFYNGVAFISIYLSYLNSNVNSIYKFIYPGYLDDSVDETNRQEEFIKEIKDKIVKKINPSMDLFIKDDSNLRINLKEAYRMNIAYAPMSAYFGVSGPFVSV